MGYGFEERNIINHNPFLSVSPIVVTSCPPSCTNFFMKHVTSIIPSCLGFAAGIIIYTTVRKLEIAASRVLEVDSKKSIEDLKVILMGIVGALILSVIVKLTELIIRIALEWKGFKKQDKHTINQFINNEFDNKTLEDTCAQTPTPTPITIPKPKFRTILTQAALKTFHPCYPT